jgi:hypothetical protein
VSSRPLQSPTSFWEASIGALWAIPMHWLLAVAAAVHFTSQHHEAVAFMPTGPSLDQITGRVPPVPVLFLVPGVTPPAEMGGLERTVRILPVRWVIYYKVDFSKDLPAVRALHDGSPSQFDQFLADAYQRDDQDGLIVFKLKS